MSKTSEAIFCSTDDLNFLRFLTIALPLGIEDPSLDPLFRPLSQKQLHEHFTHYSTQGKFSLTSKKMHLYVHVPFCATICSFCHCHHLEVKNPQQLHTYVDFIIEQIDEFSVSFDKTIFGSFTVLGGTASLLSASEIQMIFESVQKKFHFDAQAQFNFEGHPSSLSIDKLKILKGLGVRKIHLGVQSLDEGVLKKINRYQTREGVERCIKNIKELGFSCINVDLVAGLPEQTIAGFLDDIKSLVEWEVDLFNINPFSDITSATCSQGNSVTLQEVLSQRNEMILKAKEMLEGFGYGNKDQRGYLRDAANNSTKFESEAFPGGALGLGLLARSNLPGELVFKTLPRGKGFSAGNYVGCSIDKHYSMSQYAILHLLYGLEVKAFKRIFSEDFLTVFEKEIQVLIDQKIISKNVGGYVYVGPRSLKDLFNYFAYTKILLGEKIIDDLRMVYKSQYVPSKNYGSKDDLFKVFQNFEYAREYYQVGKKTHWL